MKSAGGNIVPLLNWYEQEYCVINLPFILFWYGPSQVHCNTSMCDTEWPLWVMVCCKNRKCAWRKGKWGKTRGSTAPIWNSNRGWRQRTWRRAVWWFKNWWRKAAGIWTNDSGGQGRNITRFVVIACIGSMSQCCVQDEYMSYFYSCIIMQIFQLMNYRR